jgi:hypothetical protein
LVKNSVQVKGEVKKKLSSGQNINIDLCLLAKKQIKPLWPNGKLAKVVAL